MITTWMYLMKQISSLVALFFFIFSTSIWSQNTPSLNECLTDIENHHIGNKVLNLGSCNITDEDIHFISQYIESKGFSVVFLDNNKITSKGAALLATNGSITCLFLSYNQIDDEGLILLAQNKLINWLAIDSNPVGDLGIMALAHVANLHTLSIGNGNYSHESFIYLIQNSALDHLEINDIQITQDEAQALSQNSHINFLQLDGVSVAAEDLTRISTMPSIELFNLIRSTMGDVAAEAFSANSPATILQFFSAPLSKRGYIALSTMTNLSELTISGYGEPTENPITSEYIQLINKLPALKKMTVLDASMSDEAVMEIAKNSTITQLWLYETYISDQGAVSLANNTIINWLVLAGNNIHDEGAIALSKNTSLIHLDITRNPVGHEGKMALKSSTIKSLLMDDDVFKKSLGRPFNIPLVNMIISQK